jgi:hypothetical protein
MDERVSLPKFFNSFIINSYLKGTAQQNLGRVKCDIYRMVFCSRRKVLQNKKINWLASCNFCKTIQCKSKENSLTCQDIFKKAAVYC